MFLSNELVMESPISIILRPPPSLTHLIPVSAPLSHLFPQGLKHGFPLHLFLWFFFLSTPPSSFPLSHSGLLSHSLSLPFLSGGSGSDVHRGRIGPVALNALLTRQGRMGEADEAGPGTRGRAPAWASF